MSVLGQGTAVVGGQRTTLPPLGAFNPQVYGQQTTGVPNVTPIVPPYAGSASGTSQAGNMAYQSVNGMGTADNNAMAASIAAANPHNMRVSPTWWAVIFLVGGVLLLQAVSWRDVVDAHVGVGGTRAEVGVTNS